MRSAIIDIGYNAIRAAVYENNEIGAPEIFNSKFKSDILTLLANEDLDIKHQTYLSIQYLLHIFKQLDVNHIECVATAVLREHPRAQDFVKLIKQKYNFEIKIISGEEEARLTALGLMTGIPNCKGIAADLGGGSLELVEVIDNQVGRLESLKLGTKIISKRNIENQEEISDAIRETYGDYQYDNLYMIGGALRFITRLYIDFAGLTMKNLHNLQISVDDFLYYLDKIQNSAERNKGQFGKPGKKKLNNNAILVARSMIEVFNPKKIIVSTYGLKEGVRFKSIRKTDKNSNILIEKVKSHCNYNNDKTDFSSYFAIIKPLLIEEDKIEDLLQIAMICWTLRHRFDKTIYPDAISNYILSAEIPFSHKERIRIALILVYGSNFRPKPELIKLAKKSISKQENSNCQIIGHFLYITEEIDGPVFKKPTFSIERKNNFLEINSKEILPRSIFEKVCIRLKSIAYARKIGSN